MILGPIFIGVILLQGYLRVRVKKGDEIQLSLDNNYKSSLGENDDFDELSLLKAELPNGGGRIVPPPEQSSLSLDVPMLAEPETVQKAAKPRKRTKKAREIPMLMELADNQNIDESPVQTSLSLDLLMEESVGEKQISPAGSEQEVDSDYTMTSEPAEEASSDFKIVPELKQEVDSSFNDAPRDRSRIPDFQCLPKLPGSLARALRYPLNRSRSQPPALRYLTNRSRSQALLLRYPLSRSPIPALQCLPNRNRSQSPALRYPLSRIRVLQCIPNRSRSRIPAFQYLPNRIRKCRCQGIWIIPPARSSLSFMSWRNTAIFQVKNYGSSCKTMTWFMEICRYSID